MKLTDEQVEAERVKFEIFCSLVGNKTDREPDEDVGYEYRHYNTAKSWRSWLACRDSIEIELPDMNLDDLDFVYAEIKRCIKSQGFTVVTK